MRTIFITVILATVSYHSVGFLMQHSKVVKGIQDNNNKIELAIANKGGYND